MNKHFLEGFEKRASTAYTRWLAKKWGGTPKEVTKPLYEIAKKISGKEGREAFRLIKGIGKKGKKRLSAGDPLGLQKDKVHPNVTSPNYITDLLSNSKHNKEHGILSRPTDMAPMLPDHAKGTIAKRDKVRNSAIRHYNIQRRGVGDLSKGTAKERSEKIKEYMKEIRTSMTPEQKEIYKAKRRVENLTPEQIERIRTRALDYSKTVPREKKEIYNTRQRVENLTPDKLEKRRARKRKNYLERKLKLEGTNE